MALSVSIVSREEEQWSGEASYVRVPTVNGSVGIMPGRQPLLAALEPGNVAVTPEKGGDSLEFRVESGFVSMDSDVVTVVVDNGRVD